MTTAPFLGSWEPPPGALSDYELLWTPTTDAPRVYHIAGGLVVLSSCVENRVYLPFGGERLCPNLWVLLLGPSSLFRKSTALAKARRTISKMWTDGGGPLLPDEFSREALVKRLSERAQGVLTYSEFSAALAAFGRDYMSGTKELLADLYDSPEHYQRVVGQNTLTLNNVCLSIFAASQTDWFLEKLKSGDVRGGFLARFTYWPAFEKARFMAIPKEPSMTQQTKLLTALNEIRNVRGRAVLGPGVEDRYSRWVEQHERELHGSHHVGELSPFWSRLSITALKLAVLLQLSHNRSLEVSADTLDSAIGLTNFLKASLRHLFAEEFAFTDAMRNRQKVLRLITSRPGIERRDLMRAASLLLRDFEQVVSTLSAEERICQRGKQYFPLETSAESAPVSSTGTDTNRPMFARVK